MDVSEESPESRWFAEDIVGTMREPLLVLDSNRRVLSANPAFYRTFHVDPKETQGVLVYELGNRQWDIPRLRQLLEEILPESTTIENFEVDHEFHEIGHRTMVLNARRLDDSDKILLALEDITERKRHEEELKRITREMEGFAHTVSHDLRSPVATIGLTTGNLEDRLKDLSGGEVDEEAAELIDSIKRSVERASSLITDLLTLAQVGLTPESIESVDVKAVIGSVMEEVTPLLEEEGAAIEVGDDMGRIMANPTQIRQVFANLINNALEHARGGQLVIKVSYLGQDTYGAHRYLTRDNGSGIPPEDIDLVFAPFFKGKTGTGTGIGLATVERIVNFYGGTVRAYNDAGACFEFTVNDYAVDGYRQLPESEFTCEQEVMPL